MRTYYASDKKRREEAKRIQREQKRLKRLNKNAAANNSPETKPESTMDTVSNAEAVKPESNGMPGEDN
jgi:hypothetical protein